MDKRTLLAVALSSLVFLVYYGFIHKPVPPPPVSQPAPAVATPAPAAPTSPAAPAPLAGVPEAGAEPPPPEASSVMENALVRGNLSSLSGLPVEWLLKKYFIQPNEKGPNINLLQGGSGGQPPLKLLLFPGQGNAAIPLELKSGAATPVLFAGKRGEVSWQQKVEWGPTDYSLQVNLQAQNQGGQPVPISPALRLEVEQNTAAPRGFLIFKEAPNLKFPLYRMGTKVTRHPEVEKLSAHQEAVGDISWSGIEDRYFLSLLLARTLSPQNRVVYGKEGSRIFAQLQYPVETLASGQSRDYQFTLYLGPKDPSLLAKFGEAHLEEAVDYGWFGWVALPILKLLQLFNAFLHNWGLAIIALTILIKLLLHPLTKKSMASMKAMQNLQPALQKLREKYKDDREKLNVESMELFRRHKVNPMGGCLPMLIQMPIYIALYKVLYNATELYHAPFFGFYHDLSAPDPYYIMPVLLGVFMVLQQKMTPTTIDPAQAKIMMFMPIMFSLFMIFLPLGLVLYIFVNTLLTVVQQYMHQKDISIWGLLKGRRSTS
ncbi:MAG TPA: membrane protein insertase YidC [bacterium]|nr:membrane protein insertase YidC [bacterium]